MSNVRVEVVEEDDDGLLPIGIAAIVIGGVGALVLIIVLLFFCCFRNRNRRERGDDGGGDGCCGFGRRRIVVMRHKDEPHKMRIMDRQAPQPRPIIIKERPCPAQETNHIYTMPHFVRGQHMKPWMTQEKRQRFVQLNAGAMDRYAVTMPRRSIMAAAPPALRAITAGENAYTARRDIPTAYLQRGGSLKLTTMQEGMADQVLSAGGGGSRGSSVLTHAEPEPARYHIVNSSAANQQPQTATLQATPMSMSTAIPTTTIQGSPLPMSTAIPMNMVYQQQQQPHPPGFILAQQQQQQQPDPPGFILTPQMDSSYQQGGAGGATYEITGMQNGFLGTGGGSATINIVPGENSLGQQQSMVLDPYSLVENPTATFVQGGESLYPRF